MKTLSILIITSLAFANSALHAADDKAIERARRLNEQFIQPPRQSTTTVRTPQQAIKEFKESGKAPGIRLKIKPVPSPGR